LLIRFGSIDRMPPVALH